VPDSVDGSWLPAAVHASGSTILTSFLVTDRLGETSVERFCLFNAMCEEKNTLEILPNLAISLQFKRK